jgi:hypothetical protein
MLGPLCLASGFGDGGYHDQSHTGEGQRRQEKESALSKEERGMATEKEASSLQSLGICHQVTETTAEQSPMVRTGEPTSLARREGSVFQWPRIPVQPKVELELACTQWSHFPYNLAHVYTLGGE